MNKNPLYLNLHLLRTCNPLSCVALELAIRICRRSDTISLAVRNSISRLSSRSVLVAFVLVCLALLTAPTAFGVSPPPDGGYAGNNTAEGTSTLFSLTSGIDNSGLGFQALYHNTTGNYNTAHGYQALYSNTTGGTDTDAQGSTATGYQALYSNITGSGNVATGYQALYSNTTGTLNTATGRFALTNNTTASDNTADGASALRNNTTGFANTAVGRLALFSNTTGSGNVANGHAALYNNTEGTANTAVGSALGSNTTGSANAAVGHDALASNTTGGSNTAVGASALYNNTTGISNITLGVVAGYNLTTGDNNIDIGNRGVAGESNTIRIGGDIGYGAQTATFVAGISGTTVAGGVGVVVDSNGQLGTRASTERFKDAIKPMDKASEAILALKPVTFHYKKDLDPEGTPQFGLVAEQVEKVNPDLVARDDQGRIYTVRYDAVNAMLLNEFLKQHRKVEEQEHKAQLQEATIAQQQKEIKALTKSLKEQALQIQKVSAQLEVRKPATQMVDNNQ